MVVRVEVDNHARQGTAHGSGAVQERAPYLDEMLEVSETFSADGSS